MTKDDKIVAVTMLFCLVPALYVHFLLAMTL